MLLYYVLVYWWNDKKFVNQKFNSKVNNFLLILVDLSIKHER